jgi:MFS family permease
MSQTANIENPNRLGANFIHLWRASISSNLADGVWLTAGPLLAATLTRDPVLIAGLVTAQRLPWFLFSLHSGALVDRLDRKKIMWIGNAIRTLLIAALGIFTYLGIINIYSMFVFFFLLGSVEPFVDNASFAILPRVVSQSQLEKANGRLFASSTIANEFIGPPLGSFLFALLPPLSFVLSSLAYGMSSITLATLPGSYESRKKAAAVSLAADIIQGFRWFFGNSVIRALAILITVQSLVATAAFALMVLYAQDYLGLDAVGYGVLISFGAVGGVLSGLVAERFAKTFGTGTSIFIASQLAAMAFILIGVTRSVFVAGAMLATISFSFVMANTLILSLRQTLIPDELLGRVTSVYRFIVLGSAPIGSLVGGFLARHYGLPAPYWMGGILTVIATIALFPFFNNAAVRKARAEVPK